jgi:hypothetical protein
MRLLLALLTAAGGVMIALSARVDVAYASFHCMRIHAVMGGFNGDNDIQYVELRMDDAAFPQNLVALTTIQFINSSNVVQATFTFPSNVTNAALGESILIATSDFNTAAIGGAADFVFSVGNTTTSTAADVLHPIQRPNGKVVYAPGSGGCTASIPVDSVAYGVGPTPNYGTAAVALPSNTTALRLSNLATTPTNNSTEYALTAVSTTTFSVASGSLATDFTTPRNNGRTVLRLNTSVGGLAEEPAAASLPAAAAEPDNAGGIATRYIVGAAAALLILATAGSWSVYRRRPLR